METVAATDVKPENQKTRWIMVLINNNRMRKDLEAEIQMGSYKG